MAKRKQTITYHFECVFISNSMLNVDVYYRLIDKRFAAAAAVAVPACYATARTTTDIEHQSRYAFEFDEHFTQFHPELFCVYPRHVIAFI